MMSRLLVLLLSIISILLFLILKEFKQNNEYISDFYYTGVEMNIDDETVSLMDQILKNLATTTKKR